MLLQTRKTAAWLAGRMAAECHQVALLSGELAVEQRASVIERFREGKEKVLITTNVCARGKYDDTCFLCNCTVGNIYNDSVYIFKGILSV